MAPPYPHVIVTQNLVLRPFATADAARFVKIQSNWNVCRMLRLASYPPTLADTTAWLADARNAWADETAFRFTIVSNDAVIGCGDVDEIAGGWGDLGYWLDEGSWGAGLATEAATAVRDFAFNDLGLVGLNSGHAADNPASGRVLTKLGFTHVADERRWSRPRSAEIEQKVYRLERPMSPP